MTPSTRSIRKNAGLFEEFRRGFLAVRGPDRVQFLHNLVSHDIKGLSPGQGGLACLLDRLGKIQAALLVHAHEQELILEMDPADLAKVRSLLEKYRISESVQFEDETSRYRILSLHGPSAEKILTQATPKINLPLSSLSDCDGPEESGIRRVSRWDLLRMPGYHLWVDPSQEEVIRTQLLSQGEPMGLQSAGPSEFEILRIEAGVPWPGAEIDETVILNELGSEEMVSFTKGCFVGQEIVARIKYRSHPPRLLTGFLIQGTDPPPSRSPIFRQACPEQGRRACPEQTFALRQAQGERSRRAQDDRQREELKEVGVITSACFSPTLNRVIALGFLKFGTPVNGLMVKAAGGAPAAAEGGRTRRPGALEATVASLPFIPTESG